LGKIGIGKIV